MPSLIPRYVVAAIQKPPNYVRLGPDDLFVAVYSFSSKLEDAKKSYHDSDADFIATVDEDQLREVLFNRQLHTEHIHFPASARASMTIRRSQVWMEFQEGVQQERERTLVVLDPGPLLTLI